MRLAWLTDIHLNFLSARQIEKQVKRPFPPVEGQVELIRLTHRR